MRRKHSNNRSHTVKAWAPALVLFQTLFSSFLRGSVPGTSPGWIQGILSMDGIGDERFIYLFRDIERNKDFLEI